MKGDRRPLSRDLGRYAALLAAWWLWLPLVALLWLAFINIFLDGVGPVHLSLWRTWDAWFAVDAGQRWLYILIGGIGSAVIAGVIGDQRPAVAGVAAFLGIALSIAALVMFIRAVWDNDKDLARFYSASTTFVIPDTDKPPAALSVLSDGNAAGDGERCDILQPEGGDVPACIREGVMPQAGWEPRAGSLDGARFVMTRSSGSSGNVSLLENTLTYLNVGEDREAGWSAIRDGAGSATPLYGVVEWAGGTEAPTECRFTGDYRIDRAFNGVRANSLPNLLNDRFPRLLFDESDAWGYCRGEEPVIVLPVQRQVHYKHRTATTAAGVVIARGSPSGGVVFEHRPVVRPGELPGPVYPDSLVEAQRDAVQWAGGRGLMDKAKFGFEPGDSTNQEGNDADYLLRSADDGRMYWVTPVAPRESDSQQFVAYEVVPADAVTDGALNPLLVYVLADDDPRVVNIDQLVAAATEFLAGSDPGLVSSGGKVVEFLPVRGDVWQGYVEINGRVVYRISLSYAGRIPTELVALQDRAGGPPPGDGAPGAPSPGPPDVAAAQCGRPPAELSESQLAACLRALADELASRQLATVAPAAAPSDAGP